MGDPKLFALIASPLLMKWPPAEFLHTFVSLHLALAQLWQPVPHTFALPQMFASITHTGSCIDVCLDTSFLT